jgi:hypothetical protein
MVSHSHLSDSFPTDSTALASRHRWILGTALGFSVLSLTASGLLWTQVRSLEQKIQNVAVASGSGQEHNVLKTQVTDLNQVLQAQTKKVTALTQGVNSTQQSVTRLNQDIAALSQRVDTVRQTSPGGVTMGVAELQELGHDFWVTNLMAIPNGRGTRLVGNIVNSSAVKYTDIIFNVRIANQSAKMLSIAGIPGGSQASFSLDFPDVPVEQAVKGRIDYVSANLVMFTGE